MSNSRKIIRISDYRTIKGKEEELRAIEEDFDLCSSACDELRKIFPNIEGQDAELDYHLRMVWFLLSCRTEGAYSLICDLEEEIDRLRSANR